MAAAAGEEQKASIGMVQESGSVQEEASTGVVLESGHIEISEHDDRKYRHITLPNKMRVRSRAIGT